MKRLLAAAAAVALLTAQAPAPSPSPAPPAAAPAPAADDPVIAKSGDVSMKASELKQLLAAAPPQTREQYEKDPKALDGLIRSEVLRRQLLIEARAKKWDQRPDVAEKAKLAADAVVTNTYIASIAAPPADYPSDADVQTAYEANKAKFLAPRQFHLAQIFIPLAADAPPAQSKADEKKLADLRTDLLKPKADFGAAVAKYGDVGNGPKDGDMGWLREDQLIGPVKDAVTGLQVGGITEPIRAASGWHLIKLLGTKPASTLPLSDVRDVIVQALRQQKQQDNERKIADDMQQKQPIELDEIAIAKAAGK